MKDVDVKKIVGEVAARHGVLIDENDPLMVALTANGLVLEALARELLTESRAVVEKLESASVALPEEARAALAQAADSAAMRSAETVRQGLAADIEGASLKARAIVDSAYRARSRAGMWMDVDHRRHVVGDGGVCGGLCHRALRIDGFPDHGSCDEGIGGERPSAI